MNYATRAKCVAFGWATEGSSNTFLASFNDHFEYEKQIKTPEKHNRVEGSVVKRKAVKAKKKGKDTASVGGGKEEKIYKERLTVVRFRFTSCQTLCQLANTTPSVNFNVK